MAKFNRSPSDGCHISYPYSVTEWHCGWFRWCAWYLKSDDFIALQFWFDWPIYWRQPRVLILHLSSSQGPVSIYNKTSNRKISRSLEAASFAFRIIRSLWNLAGTSIATTGRPLVKSSVKRIFSHYFYQPSMITLWFLSCITERNCVSDFAQSRGATSGNWLDSRYSIVITNLGVNTCIRNITRAIFQTKHCDPSSNLLYAGDDHTPQGAISIRKMVLPGMVIPMLKIRRPNGRLIFNMEIAIRR